MGVPLSNLSGKKKAPITITPDAPNIFDQIHAEAQQGASTTPIDFSSIGGKPVTAPIDFSSIGGKPVTITPDPPGWRPVDESTAAWKPVTENVFDEIHRERQSYAAEKFPQLQKDDLSHTLYNMTAAMSGQKLATPEDEAEGEKGKREGFESAGVTALTSLGGELLAAPKLIQVAARDPATGQFMRGLATKEGPTLLTQGVKAVQAAGEAHPLVKQALIQGLTMLGAGKIAHMLGWLDRLPL